MGRLSMASTSARLQTARRGRNMDCAGIGLMAMDSLRAQAVGAHHLAPAGVVAADQGLGILGVEVGGRHADLLEAVAHLVGGQQLARGGAEFVDDGARRVPGCHQAAPGRCLIDRKSTRLNSSHLVISYAVFCLKKKKRTSELR